MKKVNLQNFNLSGIWNVILMRKEEDKIRLEIFGKRLHHAYIGLVVLLGSFTFTIPLLTWAIFGTGLSFIVHDLVSEFI